jgi:hypothetical protein
MLNDGSGAGWLRRLSLTKEMVSGTQCATTPKRMLVALNKNPNKR